MTTQNLIINCMAALMVVVFPLAAAAGGQEGDGAEAAVAGCPLVKNPVWLVNDDSDCPQEAGLVFFPSHEHDDACDECSEDAYDFLRTDTDGD